MSDATAQPDAVRLLTADHREVEAMFRRIESLPEGDARKKVAPTHPHPKAPNTPPANLVGGVAAAVIDRAGDALSKD